LQVGGQVQVQTQRGEKPSVAPTIFLAHAESEKSFVGAVKDAILTLARSSRARVSGPASTPIPRVFYDKDSFAPGRDGTLLTFSTAAAEAFVLLLFIPHDGFQPSSFVQKELLAFLSDVRHHDRGAPNPERLDPHQHQRVLERINRVLLVDRHGHVVWPANGPPTGLPPICRTGCLAPYFVTERPRLREGSAKATEVAISALALVWGVPPEQVRSRLEARRRRNASAIGAVALVVIAILTFATIYSVTKQKEAEQAKEDMRRALEREQLANESAQREKDAAVAASARAEEEARKATEAAQLEANAKRQAMDALARSEQQTVEADLSSGAQLLSDDDPFGALPWFGDALTREVDSRRAASIRFRIASILDFMPTLIRVRLWLDRGSQPAVDSAHAGPKKFYQVDMETGARTASVDAPLATALAIDTAGDAVVFSRSDQTLWSASVDAAGQLGEAHLLHADETFSIGDRPLWFSATFSPDGRRVVLGADNFTASSVVFDVRSGRELFPIYTTQGQNRVHAAVSPDNAWILTDAGPFPHAYAYHLSDDGSPVGDRTDLETDGMVTDVHFSDDGSLALAACNHGPVYIWAVKNWYVEAKLDHPVRVEQATFLQGTRYVATLDANGTVRVWDIEMSHRFMPDNNRLVFAPFRLGNGAMSLLANADGKRLVLVDRAGSVTVWTLTSRYARTDSAFAKVELGGERLERRGDDGIEVPLKGAPVRPFLRHRGVIFGILDSDAEIVATVSPVDVRLWDAATGELVAPLLPLVGVPYPQELGFVSAQKRLVAGSDMPGTDNRHRTWDLSSTLPTHADAWSDVLAQRHMTSSQRLAPLSATALVRRFETIGGD
jgi:WD40 repeat protein